ncbi:MAG: hypothetical protein K5856_06495 [Bacteroidaceae bacterium]|nr:hypothetical protein [Bacteroidaceae bacterium]
MVYRFTIISDEVDQFLREIQIDPDATFLDFHKAILEAVNFKEGELSSFFVCDDEWNKEIEVTLEEMDTDSETDSYIMSDTRIGKLVDEDTYQKLIYVFDYMTDRCFFIKLMEVITGKHLDKPVCTKSRGEAPQQMIDLDEMEKKLGTNTDDLGEDFYGDQSYNPDEIDIDGYDGLDGIAGGDSYDGSDIY